MRTKHAERTRVGLWGQSSIHKAARDVRNGIRAAPLPVRCGSGTNQAEAGGHVTSGADEGGEWSPVQEGMAMSGSWQASRRRDA